MKLGSSRQLAAVDRTLALRARADVQLATVEYSDQTTYVLKDPLTLELFHLTAQEFFLFEKLRQSVSLKNLQQAFQERFAPQTITSQQLQQGVNQLHGQGLILSESAGQGNELHKRGELQRRSQRWQSWMKLLSFRLGSIDATSLVDGLHRRVRWLFSFPVLGITLAILTYAISILLANGNELVQRLPSLGELAQPRYWVLWLTTIAAVKVVHELAHAVTCKHFGGRCHEMGMLLLAFLPCLYCDVSDVWRLSSKWRRIAVSAAGMIVELVIAAVALIGWWHLQPGLLQTWCLSIVIVCSVGTLLVNANPLLRYDGYYILSDWVEVPNLASRARGLLTASLRRWLLGETGVNEPLLSTRQRRGLWIYAFGSRVYMTLVLLGIFTFLLTWARPQRMENLVYTLGVVTLAGILFQPVASVWRLMRNPSLRFRLRQTRLASLALLASALLIAFFYWPITGSISGPAVFVPVDARPVYATTGGRLRFALSAGTQVEAGETLFRLADESAELALARQQGEYEVRQVRYEQLGAMRAWNDQVAKQLPTARAAVLDAVDQLEEFRAKADELTIRAPKAGVVVAPPKVSDEGHDSSRLPVWSGSPLESRNLGCWVNPGTVMCTVADPQKLEALVAIDQADVAEVEAGQKVRILLESSPVRVLEGEVMQVARRAAERIEADSVQEAGKYHLVQVRLHSQDELLLVGLRGTAKIEARQSTLSRIVVNQLQEMLRLPW